MANVPIWDYNNWRAQFCVLLMTQLITPKSKPGLEYIFWAKRNYTFYMYKTVLSITNVITCLDWSILLWCHNDNSGRHINMHGSVKNANRNIFLNHCIMTPGAIQLHPWKRMILMQAKILAHCHRVINQKNMTVLSISYLTKLKSTCAIFSIFPTFNSGLPSIVGYFNMV